MTIVPEKPVVRLKVGDRAQIVHLPSRNGAAIKIPALVREVLANGYVVDTEFQTAIHVQSSDIKIQFR